MKRQLPAKIARLREIVRLFGPLLVLGTVIVSVITLGLLNAGRVHAQANLWPDPPYSPVNVNFSTGTGTLVAAPTAGGICVYGGYLVNAGTAVTVNFYLDGGTTSVGSAYLAASGGSISFGILNSNPKNPYFITNAATAFVVKQSGTSQINGSIYAANCP